ncbi:extracellular solute-binding protein [Halobium salinum]|uniref:Extracellular solute-binding protein n=1 Tax=Halobium salinum TaxID=1364940 RepID=A0ABD5PC99_9EURY|nr:extracellular solute-binding protein [Halobium salinum]
MGESRRRLLRRGAGAALVGAGGLSVGAGVLGSVGGDRAGDVAGDPSALVAGSLLGVAESTPGAAVEAHGSLAVRRFVVSDARDPDVVALADPPLFAGLTDRATLFATNALVVAYDPASEHADAVAADWSSALARDEVVLGRTDPETDPLGYRTVLVLDLAERFGVADRSALDGSQVFPETALLRNLEAGAVDAAFVYRSMAEERDLPYLDLPARIDFSDPAHAETYASVSLELEDRTVRGAPIRYAAAPLTEAGREWHDALVNGTDRLRRRGFTVPGEHPRRVRVD